MTQLHDELVGRLRSFKAYFFTKGVGYMSHTPPVCEEAADLIETQAATIEKLREAFITQAGETAKAAKYYQGRIQAQAATIERLEAIAGELDSALGGMLTFYGMDYDETHDTQRVVHGSAEKARKQYRQLKEAGRG